VGNIHKQLCVVYGSCTATPFDAVYRDEMKYGGMKFSFGRGLRVLLQLPAQTSCRTPIILYHKSATGRTAFRQ